MAKKERKPKSKPETLIPPPAPEKPVIIRDNREKADQGWFFRADDRFAGTEQGTLKTGDYTIKGYENLVTIERKKSVSEVANNLKEARFERELVRMQEEIIHPFLLMEFDLQDVIGWPRTSDLSWAVKARIKTNGTYILKKITDLMVKYPKVHWIYCGHDGQKLALAILKRVYDGIQQT